MNKSYRCAFCERKILVSKQELVLNFDDKGCCFKCGSHKDLMRMGRQQPFLFKERTKEKCTCCLDKYEEFDIYSFMKLCKECLNEDRDDIDCGCACVTCYNREYDGGGYY